MNKSSNFTPFNEDGNQVERWDPCGDFWYVAEAGMMVAVVKLGSEGWRWACFVGIQNRSKYSSPLEGTEHTYDRAKDKVGICLKQIVDPSNNGLPSANNSM